MALLAALVPSVVLASHQFTDVPDSDWAHDDITWLADNGLTNGCGDGSTFCPGDPITRRETAALLHRVSTAEVVDAGTVGGYTAEELLEPQGSGSQTIPAAAFHPTTSDAPFKYALLGDNHIVATEPDTQLCVVAPVVLPDGASIDSFTIFVYDNSAPDGISLALVRKDLNAALLGTDTIAQLSTNSDSSEIQGLTTTDITADTEVVDNASYGYDVQGCWSYTGLNAGVIRLNGAAITFTYP